MQTHFDDSHERLEFMRELKQRATEMKAKGKSQIAAGKPDEKPLAQWKGSNGMGVVHQPDDPQGIARISVGGGRDTPVRMDYCTIRGGVGQCIELLENAIAALKESPE